MREEALLWINDAERALKIAKENYSIELFEVSVFYCQQSLEKLLKGSIIAIKKSSFVKTHRLMTLYNRISKEINLDEKLVDFLKMITPYYTITRYPDTAMGLPVEVITKDFARECLNKTELIFKCFQRILSKK